MKAVNFKLGEHPNNESIFSIWLKSEDDLRRENLHRKLVEIELNNEIITQIAEWIKKHHISEKQFKLSEKKKNILKKYGLVKFIENQKYLPNNDNTKKGNLGEIILCEYLEEITDNKLLIYRLRYNPNVDQSMKGDDILLFNLDNIKDKILLGEAKFRIPATKSTVEEILQSFGGKPKLPLSLTFISNILRDDGKDDLADEIEELQVEMKDGKIPVINIGFIMGNNNTYNSIDKHHLYGDFKITKETIKALERENDFPIDALKPLINKTYKTETALYKAINAELNKKDLPSLTSSDKERLFNFTQKKINPHLVFISLSSNSPNTILKNSYKEAYKLIKIYLENECSKS